MSLSPHTLSPDAIDPRQSAADLAEFTWQPQPRAAALVQILIDEFMEQCPEAQRLAGRMRDETGTRFFDWVDSIALPGDAMLETELREVGFEARPELGALPVFVHPGGVFPKILLHEDAARGREISFKVEFVADFAAANGIELTPENCVGQLWSLVRRLRVARQGESSLWAVERHGFAGEVASPVPSEDRMAMLQWLERFRTRRRDFDRDEDGFEHLRVMIEGAVARVGRDVACDLFFSAERDYWQRRNLAAQIQKARQDRLGLGWANHDHHTYRSSRRHFARLIGLLQLLGLQCRERFYAGAEAGWGAQVMEQPEAGIVVFTDVDLSPEEVTSDFVREPLEPREPIGTAGLWCALHGEAILQGGMHHLECQFDFEALRQQLEESCGVRTMKPFTDLPYLRQAFTEGQRWPVRESRIAALLERGLITPAQAEQFRRNGAIGSHLENLQRDAGYKGFNQQGVGEIIARTDPRRNP